MCVIAICITNIQSIHSLFQGFFYLITQIKESQQITELLSLPQLCTSWWGSKKGVQCCHSLSSFSGKGASSSSSKSLWGWASHSSSPLKMNALTNQMCAGILLPKSVTWLPRCVSICRLSCSTTLCSTFPAAALSFCAIRHRSLRKAVIRRLMM